MQFISLECVSSMAEVVDGERIRSRGTYSSYCSCGKRPPKWIWNFENALFVFSVSSTKMSFEKIVNLDLSKLYAWLPTRRERELVNLEQRFASSKEYTYLSCSCCQLCLSLSPGLSHESSHSTRSSD